MPPRCVADDAAATAVLPGRLAEAALPIPPNGGASDSARIGDAITAVGLPALATRLTRTRTGTGCCRSANSSGLASPALCCTRRGICSSTKLPASPDEPAEEALVVDGEEDYRTPPSSRSATAARWTRCISAASRWPERRSLRAARTDQASGYLQTLTAMNANGFTPVGDRAVGSRTASEPWRARDRALRSEPLRDVAWHQCRHHQRDDHRVVVVGHLRMITKDVIGARTTPVR